MTDVSHTSDDHPCRDRRALGIRQPWAELIVRGVKTLEIRSQPTTVRGTIYIYASVLPADHGFATLAAAKHDVDRATLPRGVLIGTVDLAGCRPATTSDAKPSLVPAPALDGAWAWELENPRRFEQPLNIRFRPYGVWFYPFQRRQTEPARRTRRSHDAPR